MIAQRKENVQGKHEKKYIANEIKTIKLKNNYYQKDKRQRVNKSDVLIERKTNEKRTALQFVDPCSHSKKRTNDHVNTFDW